MSNYEIDVSIIVKFSESGQREEGDLVDHFELVGDQTLDAFDAFNLKWKLRNFHNFQLFWVLKALSFLSILKYSAIFRHIFLKIS